VLPLIWELVEIGRVLPSAPVAIIVTVAALVVCQLSVTVWPEAMLLLLAEKAIVGADDVTGGMAEVEPQPIKAISGAITANANSNFEHVASRPILLSLDDELSRPWLLLNIMLPPLGRL
jgi:hypothetical protein